ncbi:hypothetical protein [Desulfosoma caldarium]|uniref:Helix-turn-helix protein n=1 Tax=Desulfosoma caldarium TaxID=610254 RepID=A0A3N1VUC6_9BACT|nr:hypothetical protein [Desulfosoma caldarium]ROR03387.1 hypothetical protein EDC27_0123 [Desulfosoma caldarium]
MKLTPKDLENLLQPTPHRFAHVFKRYNVPRLAQILGCSCGHLYGVLKGTFRPSPELDAKITELAEAILEAEAEAEAQRPEDAQAYYCA